jgi:hypothetical protein
MALGVKRYKKKPVVIEAVQLPPVTVAHTNPDEYTRLLLEVAEWCGGRVPYAEGTPPLEIETLEGTHKASPGDWVIKGVKGEFYPCKPDIFEATYEEAQEGEW